MDMRTVEHRAFAHRLIATAVMLVVASAALPREDLLWAIGFASAGIPLGIFVDMLSMRLGLGVHRLLGAFLHPSTPVPDRRIPIHLLRVWIVPVAIVLFLATGQTDTAKGLLAAYGVLVGMDMHQLCRFSGS